MMAEMASPDVDIGHGCRRIERLQANFWRGHSVQDSMENTNPFSGDDNLYFERTFDFDCPEMPTSFHFRITFLRSCTPVVKSEASVRRTDKRAVWVDVTLVATVYGNGAVMAFARYDISGLGPGRVGSTIRYMALHVSANRLQEEDLLVELVFTVERCHREQQGEEATDTQDSKDSSPKEGLRVQSSS